MSHDGLVPKVFSDVHPKFQTPYKSNMLFFVFTALFAAFMPERHRRRDDQHRHAVRVHPRVRGRLDHAACGVRTSPRGFTVPALPVVAIARHPRLRRDDLRAGLDELAAARASGW